MLSERQLVDECVCSHLPAGQVPVSCLLARYWLFAGASLAVAGFVDGITLETRQGWLRMLVCHTALYREAVFTVPVAGTVSVVATNLMDLAHLMGAPLFKTNGCAQSNNFYSGLCSAHKNFEDKFFLPIFEKLYLTEDMGH